MRRLSAARLSIALIALALTARAGTHAAYADQTLRYDLRGELGGEYDSNVHRTEIIANTANPPVVASPLARAALSGHLADVVADRHQLTLSATLAGKLFAAARDEDVALASSSARWRRALGADTGLAAQAVYYEAFQRASSDPAAADNRRDFRSVTPALQLDHRISTSIFRVRWRRWTSAGRASRPTATPNGS
jgi:hypothetical protein